MKRCSACGGVLGQDCFNQEDCSAIQHRSELDTALDFIKELCDVLDHYRNCQQTVGNAVMNAMAFYDQHRPRQGSSYPQVGSSDPDSDLPF